MTCVDNGMPVVVAMAESFGLRGDEPHEQLAADPALLERIDAFRRKAGQLMGLGDVSGSSVPKAALLARPRDGGQVCTRSFIPVQLHTAIGVLAAVSVVTGMLLPGAVGHELTADWPRDRSQVDVEHPTGHLLVDVVVDADATPPRASARVSSAPRASSSTASPSPAVTRRRHRELVRAELGHQGPDERHQVGVRVGLAGDLDAPRQLHHRPAGTAPAQQLAEAGGIGPHGGVGPPAMIEMHPHRRALQQWRQRDELIVDRRGSRPSAPAAASPAWPQREQ